MASTSTVDRSVLLKILGQYSPSKIPSQSPTDQTTTAELVKSSFPEIEYTEAEKQEITQHLITSLHIGVRGEDEAKVADRLSSLNTLLAGRTTMLGSKPSLADIVMYARLAPIVTKWSAEERTGKQGHHHIVRHVNFVQHAPLFNLDIPTTNIVPVNEDEVLAPIPAVDPKAEKERKKREKEAAKAAADLNSPTADGDKKKQEKSTGDKIAEAVGSATPGVAQPSQGVKKEKKEKQPKAPPTPAKEAVMSPCLIDLRVGHILKAEKHPDADSLFVSTLACGDAPGTKDTFEYEGQVVRTVCSGLNGLVPLEELQNRKIVAVCNLKPSTMRGVKSCAMVLAATGKAPAGAPEGQKGPVELVSPPADSVAGERVCFEGFEGEPEGQLNPKKKIWETFQPGFTTTENCEIAFDASKVEQLEGKSGLAKLKTSKGTCAVKSLQNAIVR